MAAPSLQRFVDQAEGEVLVLHDQVAAGPVAGLRDAVLCSTDEVPPAPATRWAAVILAVADSAALRRVAGGLPRLGRSRSVACWLAEAERATAVTHQPGWPVTSKLQARLLRSGAAWTSVRFERPAPVNAVLEQLARDVVAARFHPSAGLVVSRGDASDPGTVVPPDVVLTSEPAIDLPAYHVTGRRAALVTDPDLVRGPLDEAVLNPTGFVQRPTEGLVDLRADGRGSLALHGLTRHVEVDPARGATARLVAALREHQGVRVVGWAGGGAGMTRLIAGLAMAGVPLTCDAIPDDVAPQMGASLASTLSQVTDLDDPLRREEHSVRLRRAALLSHSTLGWGARVADDGVLSHRRFPSCSIVLATKRPAQLEFALRQVAGQVGAEIELVVAAHGFAPDPSWVRDRAGHPATVVPLPPETLFGDVLNAGVRAASGDLIVKMDDDDWYGPDFITDLLLARHYSGADITGTKAEFVYLEAQDRTVWRSGPSECSAKSVAGGTIMVERGFLAALGGFRPVRQFVDAQLLAATAALGGSVYRAHGLGYVLRRSAEGHTWAVDDDYFLDPARLDRQWSGFVPSRALLDHGADPG